MTRLQYHLMAGILFIMPCSVFCQGILQEVDGKPLQAKASIEIQGSPYLTDEWTTGTALAADGTVYSAIPLKFNQVDDLLVFRDQKNQENSFAKSISEFKLNVLKAGNLVSLRYKKGYLSPIKGLSEDKYFEVLAEGKLTLLKRTVKEVSETREFNQATIQRQYVSGTSYYVVQAKQLNPVKNDKKTILPFLAEHRDKVDDYLKSKNPNFKNDQDLAALFIFFNSL